MAVAALAACAALLPAGVTAAQRKPPPLRSMGAFASPLRTDGVRYSAVETLTGDTLIADQRTQQSFMVKAPAGYGLRAVGGGEVLWTCACRRWSHGQHADDPLVMTIATHVFEPPPPNFDAYVESLPAEYSLYFDRIGTNWLAGSSMGYHAARLEFMNWRTGQTSDQFGARAVEDLDRPGLRGPLCKPLRRRLIPAGEDGDDFGDRYLNAVVELPWALLPFYDPKGDRYRVHVGRCGSHRRVVLDIDQEQLGAGIVTGRRPIATFQGSHAVAYVPRTGARWVWRLPNPGDVVNHAGTRLFVSGLDGDNRWKVSSAHIPRRAKK
jgi:hypothetical protein